MSDLLRSDDNDWRQLDTKLTQLASVWNKLDKTAQRYLVTVVHYAKALILYITLTFRDCVCKSRHCHNRIPQFIYHLWVVTVILQEDLYDVVHALI